MRLRTQVSMNEKGSALVYILIAIALLAALTLSFMQPSSQQTTAQNTTESVAALKSQIDLIESSIQECVLSYPGGESGLAGTFNTPYPINPSSDYYTAATAGNDDAAANDQVRHIRCPGNPGGSSKAHAKIFAGSSGRFLPPPPNLFEEWIYHSGKDGVFFYTSTDNSDAFLQTAMQKLDSQFSECQADVIDATGGLEALTSTDGANDPDCANGSTCFRVWMIIKSTAVYAGDTDGEETAGSPDLCP